MKRSHTELVLLGIILAAALAIRLWGIGSKLPFIYHPDEPVSINIIQNIFKTGDLNPHFFDYPSLYFYINSLAYAPFYILGKLIGEFHSRADILPLVTIAMGDTWTPLPSTVILSRSVSLLFGLGAIGLAYLTGKSISKKGSVGLLAAAMLAISPANVTYDRLITPDTFVTFFALASLFASILVFQHGKTWQYIVAGLCVGFTASCKYNGVLVVLPLLLAHFLRYGLAGFKHPRLYVSILLCGVAFLLTTPYALLDWPHFFAGLKYDSIHYSTGHVGMEGDTLLWYLVYAWNSIGIIPIFAVLEIVRGIFSRSKEIILVSIFPVFYFGLISSIRVRNDRTFLPLTPFLIILAASFLIFLTGWVLRLQWLKFGKIQQAFAVCILLIPLLVPAVKTIRESIQLTTLDSRETARLWIENNLPAGAKIAIESYAPFIDPSRFSVQYIGQMINHDAEWYGQQGFEYLVFSQGMYMRYYAEPEKYPLQKAQYDRLFSQAQLVKMFDDGNYEIRIYTVTPSQSYEAHNPNSVL